MPGSPVEGWPEPAGERGEHVGHHDLVSDVPGLHVDVGLRIDRIALREELVDRRLGVGGLEERAVRAALDALQDEVAFGLQPDRHPGVADRRPRLGIDEGAAAGRQHLRAAIEEALDHAALAIAEVRFAMGLEDFRDGGLAACSISVSASTRQAGARAAPDRRLAGAHHADHDDGVAAENAGSAASGRPPQGIWAVAISLRPQA
jgi:hypothetical protein